MLVGYVNNLNAGVDEETVDPEIYQRWLQLSSFSPLFWWHGMWGLRLPWEYGPQGVATAHRFMELRYRLLPYLYTCSRQLTIPEFPWCGECMWSIRSRNLL
jgi:alpha-glucosidase (family GH31 glycosyl hydrolase)